MTKSPNVPTIPTDTRSLTAATKALQGVDAGRRAAAIGASPEAKAMLKSVRDGKTDAALREPEDRDRISDAAVPHVSGGNDAA